jgi:RNA polymerase sigma factor (TIGR02999 family)
MMFPWTMDNLRVRPRECCAPAQLTARKRATGHSGYHFGVTGARDRGAGEDDPGTGSGSLRGLADELIPVFYEELRRIGRRERRRIGAGVTLQTTALVNEAYLKLRAMKGWADDRHFLCVAALAMRHALVNYAKAETAQKRGGAAVHLSLTSAGELGVGTDGELVALNEALETLARQSPRSAQVVECRYFAGYSEAETARVLGISERTVRREWAMAKAWLYRELAASRGD